MKFVIGEMCDEVFKLFQFTLNWMILMPTLHAHTFASLLYPCVPFTSHAFVALLLRYEESSYLEQ